MILILSQENGSLIEDGQLNYFSKKLELLSTFGNW